MEGGRRSKAFTTLCVEEAGSEEEEERMLDAETELLASQSLSH